MASLDLPFSEEAHLSPPFRVCPDPKSPTFFCESDGEILFFLLDSYEAPSSSPLPQILPVDLDLPHPFFLPLFPPFVSNMRLLEDFFSLFLLFPFPFSPQMPSTPSIPHPSHKDTRPRPPPPLLHLITEDRVCLVFLGNNMKPPFFHFFLGTCGLLYKFFFFPPLNDRSYSSIEVLSFRFFQGSEGRSYSFGSQVMDTLFHL